MHDLFLGDDLSRAIRDSGSSSEFFYPSTDPGSDSIRNFYNILKLRRDGCPGPKPSALWSAAVQGKKKTTTKGKTSGRSSSSSAVRQVAVVNKDWVLTDEDLSGADFDSLPPQALVSLVLKRDIFLTYEKFLEIIPPYVQDNFLKLANVSPNLFDEVKEDVDRWVKIGNDDTGLAIAKGVKSVVDFRIDPEFSKDGNTSALNIYKHLSKVVNDTSCGVLRSTSVSLRLLKKEYVDDYGSYYNLAYTVAIHCPDRICSPAKVYQRRRCQVHGIGYPDKYDTEEKRNAPVRQPWIPISYGVKIPSNVLTAVKPLIVGFTGAALSAGKLASSLVHYLTSSSVIVTPTFTTLSSTIQNFLTAKYHSASAVPSHLIAKLVGLNIAEAADIIFAKGPAIHVAQSNPTKKVQKPKAANTQAKGQKPQGTKRDHPFQGFSDKQCKRLTKSFGGDFRTYLVLKKKYNLKGDLNLLKLSNFFENGKPKFGKLTSTEVADRCLN